MLLEKQHQTSPIWFAFFFLAAEAVEKVDNLEIKTII
jgi:hypothetical protein